MLELNDQQTEELNAFIEGRLTNDQAGKVATLIDSDENYRHAYHQLQQERLIIKEAIKRDLRKKALRMLKQKTSSSTPPKGRTRFLPILRIAAGLALVTAVYFIWQSSFRSSDTSALFDRYYDMPIPSMPRSASSPDEATFAEAMKAYETGEWETMISQLSSVSVGHEGTIGVDQVRLFLGVAYLEKERFEDAVEVLDRISSSSSYYYDAQWYKALVHLKSGNRDESQRILSELSQSVGLKSPKAQELFEILSK